MVMAPAAAATVAIHRRGTSLRTRRDHRRPVVQAMDAKTTSQPR